MKHALEVKPLVVAGAIGGIVMLLLVQVSASWVQSDNPPNPVLMVVGAGILTGLGVQIGVRLTGVS